MKMIFVFILFVVVVGCASKKDTTMISDKYSEITSKENFDSSKANEFSKVLIISDSIVQVSQKGSQ